MTVVGICMVRDEADIIETVLRHHFAHGLDQIIVADNLSTDDTPKILERLASEFPLTVLEDPDPGYYQDRKMSKLAMLAHEAANADWVLPFDADEFWYPESGTLAEFFASCDSEIIEGVGWDHIATTDDGGLSPRRRRHPQKLPKVAFLACGDPYIHMGNHDVDRHRESTRGAGLFYRHFQYRSFEQMARKVRNGREAYEASDLHWNYGTHWRELGALSDEALRAQWDALQAEEGLIFDPAPIRA